MTKKFFRRLTFCVCSEGPVRDYHIDLDDTWSEGVVVTVKEKYRFNEYAGGGSTGLGGWLLGQAKEKSEQRR